MPGEKPPIDLSDGLPNTAQSYSSVCPAERELIEKALAERVESITDGAAGCEKDMSFGVGLDREVVAIQEVVNALSSLKLEQKIRVIQYAVSRSLPEFILVPTAALLAR